MVVCKIKMETNHYLVVESYTMLVCLISYFSHKAIVSSHDSVSEIVNQYLLFYTRLHHLEQQRKAFCH